MICAGKNFCPSFAAKWLENRITIKQVTRDFNDLYLGIDTKFARTFLDLFNRPQAAITVYMTGRRVNYMDAVRYLLLVPFLYLWAFDYCNHAIYHTYHFEIPRRFSVLGFVSFPLMYLCNMYCYKRCFKLDMQTIILKTLISIFVVLSLSIVIMIAAGIIGIIFGMLLKATGLI